MKAAAKIASKEPAIRPKPDANIPVPGRAEPASAAHRWLTGIVAAGTLIPLIVSVYGEDSFRYPKELGLRVEAILIAAALALVWGFGRLRFRVDVRERWLMLTAAICLWTIVCALVSTNRLVSLPPTIRVLEYALLFVVTVLVMREKPAWFAGLIVPAGIVNALVYALQELDLWSPFTVSPERGEHLTRTALIGNPNDVGSYFVVPALMAAALALSERRWRLGWAAAAALIAAATVMTHTVAAIGALFVALAVLFALRLRSWPKTVAALLACIVLAGGAFAFYQPLRERVRTMRDAFAQRDLEALSAARTVPFLTAAAMTRDRPLFGVGPGCFAYNFFEYKIRASERYRWVTGRAVGGYNFGEVHNDHLQVASETGLPGYLLLLAALVLLASGSWRSRHELVRLLALPLAVSFFVLALAQFPLELVAPTHVYLWAAAAVVAWKES
jgi:O-antigen ligase